MDSPQLRRATVGDKSVPEVMVNLSTDNNAKSHDHQHATGGGLDVPAPICIAGMHRSGTSMVAKLLSEAGLHLGTATDLMPPAEQNPEGFYEHLEFVRLNDEVLNAAGAGWDCPPPAGYDWQSAKLDSFRDRARLLATLMHDAGRWGWKDPRNSLTLPFWQSALGPLRTVVVVRNPLEVVTSLHRRDGFSIALSLTLWRIYTERILENSAPDRRLVTHFDAYFLEPEREISRLLAFVGLDGDHDLAALRQTAFPDLRHHRKSLHDLVEHEFPPEIIALYRRLSREAGWWEGDDGTGVSDTTAHSTASNDAIARGYGAVDLLRVENGVLRRNNADFTAALAERELRITELEMALRGHESYRAELDGKVAERDSKISERNALLVVRDQAITASQHQLAQTTAELAQRRQQVASLEQRLAESERSRTVAELHERDLRSMLTALQAVQLNRDAEIMGTLGSVLSRHAPGAPAAIYHRRLVGQVRTFADTHIPPGARTLVANYGDPAFLALGERRTEPFPAVATGVTAGYTDVNGHEAVAQLERLRDDGAEFFLIPSPALPWLTNHPELERHLDLEYTCVARERGIGAIYALNRRQGQIPA